ncbi:hypothetical protein K1719_012313 [Acacia pycnantha]|nr:hypothetical protein K1719_012313 [Acacia pycnantha]
MKQSPYDKDFPPLERRTDENTRVYARPYVTANTIDSQGWVQHASASDEVLNWHTRNVVCQNKALTKIDSKLDSLAIKTYGLASQMEHFSEEFQRIYAAQSQQAKKWMHN